MAILIAAATSKEIAPLIAGLGKSGAEEIDILITGIGVMRTTYALATQVRLKRPELIIQAGVAGCFDEKIPLGSVVAISKDTLADLGVREGGEWRTSSDLSLEPGSKFPATKGWLKNKHKEILRHSGLKSVKAITVNQITTGKSSIEMMRNRFDAVAESMEGAACHYVGLMEDIPFLQVRAFSNYLGERNKTKWKLKESIENLNSFLFSFLSDKK